MIVIVGGMHRSGSTFTFNIVRELLAIRGGVHVAAVNSLDEAFAETFDAKHLVIKSHAPDFLSTRLIEKGILPCVCTFRKPEDAVASWMRAFGANLEVSTAIISDWLKWYRQISPYVLNIGYETIDRHSLRAILLIQTYLLGWPRFLEAVRLWRKYDKRVLKEKYDRLQEGDGTKNIGFSYYDNQTFFHRRHISSVASKPADGELIPEQLAFIRDQLKDFVDSNGNYPNTDKRYLVSTNWLDTFLDMSRRGTV